MGIYRRETMVSNENKEKKKRNEQNRTRNQTFFIESCLYQKILVKGNIKSFDKIKKRLDELEGKLSSPAVLAALDDVDLETIRMILEIMDHLYGGRKERK